MRCSPEFPTLAEGAKELEQCARVRERVAQRLEDDRSESRVRGGGGYYNGCSRVAFGILFSILCQLCHHTKRWLLGGIVFFCPRLELARHCGWVFFKKIVAVPLV